MAKARKRFQAGKLCGDWWLVIDVVKNATLGAVGSRQVAKAVAADLNKKAAERS